MRKIRISNQMEDLELRKFALDLAVKTEENRYDTTVNIAKEYYIFLIGEDKK